MILTTDIIVHKTPDLYELVFQLGQMKADQWNVHEVCSSHIS